MGYWNKAGKGLSSWIFLKDSKPAFNTFTAKVDKSRLPAMLLYHIYPQIMVLEQMIVAIHVAQQVLNCDIKLLSVAYVSGFIPRHVLRGINCVDCTTCLASPLLLANNAFIYFREYKEDKVSESEKLVDSVGACVSLLESNMANVAYMGSV
jgi:hypothetical protein